MRWPIGGQSAGSAICQPTTDTHKKCRRRNRDWNPPRRRQTIPLYTRCFVVGVIAILAQNPLKSQPAGIPPDREGHSVSKCDGKWWLELRQCVTTSCPPGPPRFVLFAKFGFGPVLPTAEIDTAILLTWGLPLVWRVVALRDEKRFRAGPEVRLRWPYKHRGRVYADRL